MRQYLLTAFRSRLERFARGRVLWRRLPEEFGRIPIRVSPDARLGHLKFGEAGFDHQLFQLAKDYVRKDSVVWDVGANVGVFSYAAASFAREGYVLAIEPDPWLFNLLEESRLHPSNLGLNLEAVNVALSSSPCIGRLVIAARGRASNYLEPFGGRSQAGGRREVRLVPVLTIDLLAKEIPMPTIIKVDVEGAEWAVLQGASHTIERSRPVIAIEVGDATRQNVATYLHSMDYELRELETNNVWSIKNSLTSNILAVPQ